VLSRLVAMVVGCAVVASSVIPAAGGITIDNFNEGFIEVTDFGDSPVEFEEPGLNPANVLGGTRGGSVNLWYGGDHAGIELYAPPDEAVLCGVVTGSGPTARASFEFYYDAAGADLTAGGQDRFVVVLDAGTYGGGEVSVAVAWEVPVNDAFFRLTRPVSGPSTYEFPYSDFTGVDLGDVLLVALEIVTPDVAVGDVALYYVDDFGTAPEPATLALVALGGLGVLAGHRRYGATATTVA